MKRILFPAADNARFAGVGASPCGSATPSRYKPCADFCAKPIRLSRPRANQHKVFACTLAHAIFSPTPSDPRADLQLCCSPPAGGGLSLRRKPGRSPEAGSFVAAVKAAQARPLARTPCAPGPSPSDPALYHIKSPCRYREAHVRLFCRCTARRASPAFAPPLRQARLTNLKTCVWILINFTYESVKYFNFLRSGAVEIFGCLMDNYLLNERVEHFSSQFRGFGVLLD